MNACFFSAAAQKNVDECMAKTKFEDAWHCLEAKPHGAGHGGVGGLVGSLKKTKPRVLKFPSQILTSTRFQMVNVQLSPGDPLFWLHHTYLDSLWWRWQSEDLAKRIKEIGGANMPPQANGILVRPPGQGPPPECLGNLPGNGTVLPSPALPFKENTAFTHYFNDGGSNITMNHTLWSAGILPNATIADIMDIRGPYVCAEYL